MRDTGPRAAGGATPGADRATRRRHAGTRPPKSWLLSPVGTLPRTVIHRRVGDRKSTRLNSSHVAISYAVFCLKKKKLVEMQNVIAKKKINTIDEEVLVKENQNEEDKSKF